MANLSSIVAPRSGTRATFTATAGQTVFSTSYTVGSVDVWLNGIKLVSGTDFTATNGTSITLATAAALNDTVEVISYGVFSVANAATLTGTETLTNKTLTSPVISTISNSGTVTIPAGTDTLVGRATTDTLTNKTLTRPVTTSIRETVSTFSPTAGTTVTLDLSTANVFVVTLPSSGTVTIGAPTNPPASGTYFEFAVKFVTTGSAAVTFNSAFKFPGGIAPTLTAVTGKVDTFVAYTTDGGTTYQAFTAGLNA